MTQANAQANSLCLCVEETDHQAASFTAFWMNMKHHYRRQPVSSRQTEDRMRFRINDCLLTHKLHM